MGSFAKAFSFGFGVELDVRDYNSKIIISHDPPNSNKQIYLDELFNLYMNHNYNDLFLAINIKSDGIGQMLNDLLAQYSISNYFIFDMSIPETVRYNHYGLKYFTRMSEYETEPVLVDNASGIWIDAFDTLWYSELDLLKIIQNKKTLCIVSSELHGRDYINQWSIIKNLNNYERLFLCTDIPTEAEKYFNS
tara:strand:- start:1422 stop:1997 length:576 start_codon:yes stop_codon:yes gene_type:complete